MNIWLRRLRGAAGMGITWAIGWAIGGVGLAALWTLFPNGPLNWFFTVFDAPAPALAVPGFFAGAFFSFLLAIAARNRKISDLSMPIFIAWGASGGAMLSLLPAFLELTVGGATPAAGTSIWEVTAVFAGPLVLFSALSAWGTLALARKAEGAANAGPPSELGEGEARPVSRRPVSEEVRRD